MINLSIISKHESILEKKKFRKINRLYIIKQELNLAVEHNLTDQRMAAKICVCCVDEDHVQIQKVLVELVQL